MLLDLPQRLIAALSAARPAGRAPAPWAPSLTPSLSYGRHRGPAPASARRAAVAVLWLRRDDGSWSLPLTLRPQGLRHHGGQISFPGGMIEAGETPAQAALREFEEELGQAPLDPLMCGELSPLYVYASNNLVFPVVFTATAPPAAWDPDPVEVQRVLEMPLSMLLDPAHRSVQQRTRQVLRDQQRVGVYRFRSVVYRLEDHVVWGATAMLLGQIAHLLSDQADSAAPAPGQASARG